METSKTAVLNGNGRKNQNIEELNTDFQSTTSPSQSEVGTTDGNGLAKTLPATETQTETKQEQETVAPTPAPPQKKRPIALILAGLGLGAIAAGTFGYNWWQYASTHQETDNATVVGHIHQISSRINGTVGDVLVNVNQPVKKGQLLVKLDPTDYQIKVSQAQASLVAAQRQASAAQANIALASETASASTAQAQGDVSGAQAGIADAKAAVAEAQAGIPAAQAAVAEAQAGVPAAQAQLQQANATLVKAQADYQRYNSLFQEGAVPRQQVDTAKAAYEVALAQRNAATQGVQQAQAKLAQAKVTVTQAQAALAQAQEGVRSAEAKLAASRGGLQQATAKGQQTQVNRSQYEAAVAAIAQSQASLKDAQQQLSYTNITSPTDGWVGNKNVEVGNRIQAGQALMGVVGQEIWVTANFKETQIENMRPGQPVEIKLDAFSHHPFKGRVDSISPASGAQFSLLPPDNATGNFTKVVQRIPVKIVLDAESVKGYESRISPGMSAEVSVEVK